MRAQVLYSLGMLPTDPGTVPLGPPSHLSVMLDGNVVGAVASAQAPALVNRCARRRPVHHAAQGVASRPWRFRQAGARRASVDSC